MVHNGNGQLVAHGQTLVALIETIMLNFINDNISVLKAGCHYKGVSHNNCEYII